MKNLLCIDYGDQHVGLAVAATTLAEPLKTVPLNQALSFITGAIKQFNVSALVFGISEGAMAEKTRSFAATIEAATHLPVHFQDETLSSYDTRLHVAQAGVKRSKREQKIDHLVAATILQDFLDTHPNLLQ